MDAILQAKGFGRVWRKWIQGYISSANFSIIINGRPGGKIIPTHGGIRQDDLLSPFLFILVVDCLSHLLDHSISKNLIATQHIGASSFFLNHLQIADYSLLFSTADRAALTHLFEVTHVFEQASSLSINLSNSEILDIHISDDDLHWMVSAFGCKRGHWPASYLGLPLGGNSKSMIFGNQLLRNHKLHNWKHAYISKGGRHTLFLAPNDVIWLEKLIRDFLWDGS